MDATVYDRAGMFDASGGVVWNDDGFDADRMPVDIITIAIKRGCVNRPDTGCWEHTRLAD